jgi:hypothetical protein
VTAAITIAKLEEFHGAFGELGAKVGPRRGNNRRTQDDKDWYVVRRFLKEAIVAKRFQLPLKIERGHPPEPDFAVEYRRTRAMVEITEATNEADQREMTLQEVIERPILLGELGGRFKGGAGEPGHVWTSDVVEAIERKVKKTIFFNSSPERHLVIYPNSNASALISSREDERRAFALLLGVLNTKRANLERCTNGCLLHVLGKEYIFFDILGKAVR